MRVRGHGLSAKCVGGHGKILVGGGRGLCLSWFLFSFLVMCMGEPIILPTVITDPKQLYPEPAKHIPSSNGEQPFMHGEELCKMMNLLQLHLFLFPNEKCLSCVMICKYLQFSLPILSKSIHKNVGTDI